MNAQYILILSLYLSKDGSKIILYIQGGNAADSYFSKIIIHKTGRIQQQTLPYNHLSETGSFYPDFKGF